MDIKFDKLAAVDEDDDDDDEEEAKGFMEKNSEVPSTFATWAAIGLDNAENELGNADDDDEEDEDEDEGAERDKPELWLRLEENCSMLVEDGAESGGTAGV